MKLNAWELAALEHAITKAMSGGTLEQTSALALLDKISNEKPSKRKRDYSDIDPSDIDPETNEPYENYSSPCIEPHPFGGGIKAGDY